MALFDGANLPIACGNSIVWALSAKVEKMSGKTKEAVLSAIQTRGGDILAAGVTRLGLFGSFVRNEQRPDSDIDFLVEFDPTQKTFDNFIKVSLLLEELCDRRVELVTAESLSPYLRPHIVNEVEYVNLGLDSHRVI